MTTAALADRAGCTRSTLLKRRRGEGWSTAEMARFGHALGVPQDAFVVDDESFWRWWTEHLGIPPADG